MSTRVNQNASKDMDTPHPSKHCRMDTLSKATKLLIVVKHLLNDAQISLILWSGSSCSLLLCYKLVPHSVYESGLPGQNWSPMTRGYQSNRVSKHSFQWIQQQQQICCYTAQEIQFKYFSDVLWKIWSHSILGILKHILTSKKQIFFLTGDPFN